MVGRRRPRGRLHDPPASRRCGGRGGPRRGPGAGRHVGHARPRGLGPDGRRPRRDDPGDLRSPGRAAQPRGRARRRDRRDAHRVRRRARRRPRRELPRRRRGRPRPSLERVLGPPARRAARHPGRGGNRDARRDDPRVVRAGGERGGGGPDRRRPRPAAPARARDARRHALPARARGRRGPRHLGPRARRPRVGRHADRCRGAPGNVRAHPPCRRHDPRGTGREPRPRRKEGACRGGVFGGGRVARRRRRPGRRRAPFGVPRPERGPRHPPCARDRGPGRLDRTPPARGRARRRRPALDVRRARPRDHAGRASPHGVRGAPGRRARDRPAA
ncbi:hypothetical protein OJAG_00110 [Oerskovia enterophila]|uniref:Uncharacterized protein n=1 Tax=Oerskovia enterophila TaxID=43678 RepID=A0A161YL83_9CELL|nr:hypothetical protein OJAG_00110 [Oerskovia enterophila]